MRSPRRRKMIHLTVSVIEENGVGKIGKEEGPFRRIGTKHTECPLCWASVARGCGGSGERRSRGQYP